MDGVAVLREAWHIARFRHPWLQRASAGHPWPACAAPGMSRGAGTVWRVATRQLSNRIPHRDASGYPRATASSGAFRSWLHSFSALSLRVRPHARHRRACRRTLASHGRGPRGAERGWRRALRRRKPASLAPCRVGLARLPRRMSRRPRNAAGQAPLYRRMALIRATTALRRATAGSGEPRTFRVRGRGHGPAHARCGSSGAGARYRLRPIRPTSRRCRPAPGSGAVRACPACVPADGSRRAWRRAAGAVPRGGSSTRRFPRTGPAPPAPDRGFR